MNTQRLQQLGACQQPAVRPKKNSQDERKLPSQREQREQRECFEKHLKTTDTPIIKRSVTNSAIIDAGGLHQVHDSSVNVGNETEIPDIDSLSICEKNATAGNCSEKQDKQYYSNPEATPLIIDVTELLSQREFSHPSAKEKISLENLCKSKNIAYSILKKMRNEEKMSFTFETSHGETHSFTALQLAVECARDGRVEGFNPSLVREEIASDKEVVKSFLGCDLMTESELLFEALKKKDMISPHY